jgi:hypothetical protein
MPQTVYTLAGALRLNNTNNTRQTLAGALRLNNTNNTRQTLAGKVYLVNPKNLWQTLPGQLLLMNTNNRTATLAGSVKLLDGAFIFLSAGDLAISWRSRNRFEVGFNLMNSTTVAEDADFKQFRIEVYDVNDNLLRTVEQAGKSWTYTAAEQSTDGGPFEYYRVRIYQDAELYQGLPYEFHIFII